MELIKELFEIPYKDRKFLYAPLIGSVLEVTPSLIGFLNQIESGADPNKINPDLTTKLIKNGILLENSKPQLAKHEPNVCNSKIYAPTSVTLLPTYNCNLRCIYCYARAGEDTGEIMNSEIVKASLDLIVTNAVKQNKKQVSLGFHGGGEPLLEKNMQILNYSLDYLKQQTEKNNLNYRASVVTNGVHPLKTIEWAVKNLDSINVSIDGPKDIQNTQRPRFAKKDSFLEESFDNVMQTIHYLENAKGRNGKKFQYGIRATITANSVRRMPEILEFFHSISSNKSFHLEPLFECGRCFASESKSPDPKIFLEQLLLTQEKAKKLGVEVYYSGGSLDKISQTFCGACGSNFFVTPGGFVTSCLEACREEDAISNIFFIGQYNHRKKEFEFNQDRIKTLSERKVENISFCENCFAKYNCSGDCPAKVYEQTGDLLNPSKNWRCAINQGLLIERIVQALDQSKEQIAKLEIKNEDKKC